MKLKIGDILKSGECKIEITHIDYSKHNKTDFTATFSAIVLDHNLHAKGSTKEDWFVTYWERIKKKNTPLWRALNG